MRKRENFMMLRYYVHEWMSALKGWYVNRRAAAQIRRDLIRGGYKWVGPVPYGEKWEKPL